MEQHHDVLSCKNVGTPSAQLSNYHRFYKTFLWLTHAVARSTDPWLLKWRSVYLLKVTVSQCCHLLMSGNTHLKNSRFFGVTLYICNDILLMLLEQVRRAGL